MPPVIDNTLRFGDIDHTGKILRDVRICAISGQPIEPGDMLIIFPGTGKFSRVKAPLTWPQNEEKFTEARKELERIAKSLATPSVTEAPAEDAGSKGKK